MQVVCHDRIAGIDRGSLCGDLQLAGNADVAIAGNYVVGIRDADLLVGGCGPGAGVRRIEPAHRVAVRIRDLLQHPQIGGGRQKPAIKHRRRENHLVHEVVLLLGDVVGLQCRRRDFDRVREDLLALFDLLKLVGNGLFFVFDLHNGVGRLRRIVDEKTNEQRPKQAAPRPFVDDGQVDRADRDRRRKPLKNPVNAASRQGDRSIMSGDGSVAVVFLLFLNLVPHLAGNAGPNEAVKKIDGEDQGQHDGQDQSAQDDQGGDEDDDHDRFGERCGGRAGPGS